MNKQLNIRILRALALILVFAFIAIMITVGNSFGRYGTKVPNVLRCNAKPEGELYVQGLKLADGSGSDGSFEVLREQLATSSEWATKGGEQYVTFTVSNSNEGTLPEKDISFRIRVLVLTDDEGSGDMSKYSALNFALESDDGKYYSRIDNVNPQTAFSLNNSVGGWMYSFCEAINNEVTYTLNGNEQDEITFTLSLADTGFDCSEVSIYVDRIG